MIIFKIIYYLACFGVAYSLWQIVKRLRDHKKEEIKYPDGNQPTVDIKKEVRYLVISIGIAFLSLLFKTILIHFLE
jgi:hypothetical protein